MQVAISGASGFIGSALTAALNRDGHEVIPLVRGPARPNTIAWNPAEGTIDAGGLDGLDAVVHLAGESIGAGRWSDAQVARIRESRTLGTALVANALRGLSRPPAVLVSASAIGFYGDRGDEPLTESSAPGTDLLAGVCQDWERAVGPAEDAGIRVARVRTGIVLGRRGGALAKQLPLFKLGLGGKVGTGRQWMSWISLDDEIRAIRHVIDAPSLAGPVNLAAPNPVTNETYTRTLAGAVHRPAFVRVPGFVRKAPLGVGPLLESLLFVSQRVEPAVLVGSGFEFLHPTLDEAFEAILSSP